MAKTKKTELNQLKDLWYQKLKETGFKDIENENGVIEDDGIPRSVNFQDEMQRQIVQDYYSMATCFLNAYKFESELEKVMWEYHTNGLPIRDIVKLINNTKVKTVSRTVVGEIIYKLTKVMKAMYLSV